MHPLLVKDLMSQVKVFAGGMTAAAFAGWAVSLTARFGEAQTLPNVVTWPLTILFILSFFLAIGCVIFFVVCCFMMFERFGKGEYNPPAPREANSDA